MKRFLTSALLCTIALFPHRTSCSIPSVTVDQSRELSRLLNMPENTRPELYNKLIQEEVAPILTEQIVKYHPGEAEPDYQISTNNAWSCSINAIDIPIHFIISIIEQRIHNAPTKRDLTFWDDIAALHHEMTHIKNQHIVQKIKTYGLDTAVFFYELCALLQHHNNRTSANS